MKQFFFSLLFLVIFQSFFAQTKSEPKFYLGTSFGTSYTLGDFEDQDIGNPDAGFADDGSKLDVFGGFFLNESVTLTGVFRYQTYNTNFDNVIETFRTNNPNVNFTGNSEDWNVYSLLVGAAYKINIAKKFSLFPRIAVGPMLVNSPGIQISSPDVTVTQNFSRSSENGFGFGYEIGIGLTKNLGKHFALMPTFTFSGGFATITNVNTTTDNVLINNNIDAVIQSFNLGISLAYRFY